EFLVPELILGITGEPLESRIDELEPAVHVVGDHPLAHGRGDGLQLAADFGGGADGTTSVPAFSPEQNRQHDQQRDGDDAENEKAGWGLNQWDHESCAGLESGVGSQQSYAPDYLAPDFPKIHLPRGPVEDLQDPLDASSAGGGYPESLLFPDGLPGY